MYITNEMLLDVPKWERLLYYSHRSMISFGKIFLAGDFLKSDTPAFHEEIGKELDSDSTKPFGKGMKRYRSVKLDTDLDLSGSFNYDEDLDLFEEMTIGEISE